MALNTNFPPFHGDYSFRGMDTISEYTSSSTIHTNDSPVKIKSSMKACRLDILQMFSTNSSNKIS